MFEADSPLKLLPPSIVDIYKVIEHIDMLSICDVNWHTVAALNSYTHTPWQRLPPCPHCCPCCAGGSSCHTGVIFFAGIFTFFVLASLPSLCCHHRPCCAGVVASVVLMVQLLVVWSTMSAQQGQRRLQIDCMMKAQEGQRGLHNKGANASALRATTSA